MSDFRDDFWDIEKLVPKKKTVLSPFSTKPKTVLLSDSEEQPQKNPNTSLTLPQQENKSETITYDNAKGLIRNVTITKFTDKYDFYGNFRKAALVYYDFKSPKCDFVPFYSYMPQYSQLNAQQKSYYFYWRDSVRRGKYIKSDYSYFYLYIYEIINLPDKIPAKTGLDMLLTLWRAYRKDLPNIDFYMSLWVEDYCLINRLEAPTRQLSDFIFDVISAAEFKEFYLFDVKSMGASGTSAMLAYLSDYDWRRGKYAGGDNREAYEKHMLGAMSLLIDKLLDNGEIFTSDAPLARISRNAFRNSLCTHSVKCRLEVEYVPLSKADNLCRYVTAAVKYTENRLRAYLGVKSRLAVKDLPDEYKNIIDKYFDGVFEKVKRERLQATMPEYEKLYEARAEVLSFDGADEIERDSWSTTARLVSENEEDAITPVFVIKNTAENENIKAESDDSGIGLDDSELHFIKAVKEFDCDTIKRISESFGMMPDSFAERINEKVSQSFGDVVIDGFYPEMSLIEEYEEDIEKWLLKITK